MKTKKATLFSLLFLVVILFSSCATNSVPPGEAPRVSSEVSETAANAEEQHTLQGITGELTISYLDVGQADSIFIALPNGETMLIDAGEASSSGDIIQYIQSNGKTTLDYVIATHPHADHIGGMAAVLQAFDVKHFYMPDKMHTSQTFERMIQTVREKGLAIQAAKAGNTLFDYGNLKAAFVAPGGNSYAGLNNASAAVLLTYNDRRFLFMGDAERESESDILAAGYDVAADILKVGHHGSDTSTSEAFLERVNPQYAVISCGEGNSYGHPDSSTIAALEQFGVEIHRTDLEGTIVATCDGQTITLDRFKKEVQPRAPAAVPADTPVSKAADTPTVTDAPKKADTPKAAEAPTVTDAPAAPSQEQSVTVYITRTGKKYHRDGCQYLRQSKIPISLEDAKQYYTPCSVCNPPQ